MGAFVNYRDEFEAFARDYPMREVALPGGGFSCILAGPEDARHTIVLMNGGMNSYEMWLRYVRDLSADHRVLSFDYPEAYDTIRGLCGGIRELLGSLGIERAVFVGASLGGLIAQVYALLYPRETEALCLMSTGGFTQGTLERYGGVLKLLRPLLGLMRVLPYSWFVSGEKRLVRGYLKEADEESKAYFKDVFDHIYEGYTREKDIHVGLLQLDLGRQRFTGKDDYAFLAGRVLLLLPEDDSEFPQKAQQELIGEMTDPVVVSDIRGGHLTTMLNYRRYLECIRSFVDGLPRGAQEAGAG